MTRAAILPGLLATGSGLLLLGWLDAAAWAKPIVLPGTQPGGGGVAIAKPTQCMLCHSKTPNGDADPYASWSSGMMAQSARDPIFLLALDVANKDIAGSGEYCIRCHVPRAWMGKRAIDGDIHAADEEDMNGVSCDVCHRAVDPLSPEALEYVSAAPTGYGNAMVVIDPRNVVRGPYVVDEGVMPHLPVKDAFPSTSEMCAQCHDVSNPALATDPMTQVPYAYGALQRTYSEWLASDNATLGSCQSCHMPTIHAEGQAARYQDTVHDHFVTHEGTGGSVWQLGLTAAVWPTQVDHASVEKGQERSKALLTTAASLTATVKGSLVVVKVTNNTAHKLPTGFPDGRRVWVHVRFLNDAGKVIEEQGAYAPKPSTYNGVKVTVSDLIEPEKTRVYETRAGMSTAQAAKYGMPAGGSYHLNLNDTIIKDTRIPPKGATNAELQSHLAGSVGANYTDGQYWDEFALKVPLGATKVEAELLYQGVTWDYAKFLMENSGDRELSEKVWTYWKESGGCAPDLIAATSAVIGR